MRQYIMTVRLHVKNNNFYRSHNVYDHCVKNIMHFFFQMLTIEI